jgi:hypothetical protein
MLLTKLDLEKDEKIIHEVRKHWFILLGHLFAAVALILLPLVVFVVGLAFAPAEIADKIINQLFLAVFLYCLWFLGVWMMLFVNWTNFYLDVWYITDRRIIDIEQKTVFHREVSNLRFDKIQDITIEVRGMIATFLKFGDLRVQTAAENSRDFVMKNAARPEEVRKVIFQAHNSQKGSQSANNAGNSNNVTAHEVTEKGE